MLIRAQEMTRYVCEGVLDAGLTGLDWVAEHKLGRDAHTCVDEPRRSRLLETEFRQGALGARRARGFALQVAGRFRGRDDRHRARAGDAAATSKSSSVPVKRVEFSWGATEVKPPVLADAIVEATETGSTLRANRLRILDTVLESNTQLIANQDALADSWKRTKIDNIALLLRAAIEAQGRVGLMLNVRRADLDKVLAQLPALQRPTISSLSDEEWVAVNTIIEERTVRDLIPKLKAAGGQGIVEYPLNKIVCEVERLEKWRSGTLVLESLRRPSASGARAAVAGARPRRRDRAPSGGDRRRRPRARR